MTNDFPTLAERPLFSALNCDAFAAAFGLRMPDWKDALRLALTDPAGENEPLSLLHHKPIEMNR